MTNISGEQNVANSHNWIQTLTPTPVLLVQDSGLTADFLQIYDSFRDTLRERQYVPKAVFVVCQKARILVKSTGISQESFSSDSD